MQYLHFNNLYHENKSCNILDLKNGKKCLFVCKRGDTIQYHGGLRSRELGQAPMLLVFLTPRQGLSPHLRQTDGRTVLATG